VAIVGVEAQAIGEEGVDPRPGAPPDGLPRALILGRVFVAEVRRLPQWVEQPLM
jgi:hypothetical protein